MMLSTALIQSRFESIFNSEGEITIPFRTKSTTITKTFKGSELKKYRGSCEYLVDRILHFNQFRTRGLVNIKPSLFINLRASDLDQVMGQRKRITTISILKTLGIIEVNPKYCFNPNVGRPFPMSYRIVPDYFDNGKVISIEGGILKDQKVAQLKVNINQDKGGIIEGMEGDSSSVPPLWSYLKDVHHRLDVPCEHHQLTKSKVTGWIYSPLAGMEKKKRNTEVIEKHNLVDIDITRAHLQFLLSLINDNITDGNYTPIFGEHAISYFMKEFEVFKTDVMNTDFYGDLIKKYGSFGLWENHRTRASLYAMNTGKDYYKDKVKSTVMIWLSSSHRNWKMVKHLRTTYPQITHFLDCYNQGTSNRLLNRLMEDESKVINPIIEYVMTNYPESICCPIFDGFIVEQSFAGIIESRFKEHGLLFKSEFKP